LLRTTALADSVSAPRSHLEPLRVAPVRCLPADSLAGAEAGPGGEMAGAGEAAHVGSDLGQQHLGGAAVDAGDAVE